MPLTEHEAQIRDLKNALTAASELTYHDSEGRPITARRSFIPYIVWDFTRPDGRRARVAITDEVKVFKLLRGISMHGEWPARMLGMPEFEEFAGEGH